MENEQKSNKRLIVDISQELHQDIKIRAAYRNVSIKHWLLQAIEQKKAEEDRYNN